MVRLYAKYFLKDKIGRLALCKCLMILESASFFFYIKIPVGKCRFLLMERVE